MPQKEERRIGPGPERSGGGAERLLHQWIGRHPVFR